MGMYAKLRHVSVTTLRAAKKEPAKFYRELYGLKGKPLDQNAFMQSLAAQLGEALKASPAGREFIDLPECRHVAEAKLRGKTPEPADEKVMAAKIMELLPKINFRPDFSPFLQSVAQKTRLPEGLELEKSWHCLHFLLSGKVENTSGAPIEWAILGGAEIPDPEQVMGYGPARYLEPGEVKKVSTALDSFPIQQKASEFDPATATAAEVYCPDHGAEELVHYFNLVKTYYREAALKRHAMLIWIE